MPMCVHIYVCAIYSVFSHAPICRYLQHKHCRTRELPLPSAPLEVFGKSEPAQELVPSCLKVSRASPALSDGSESTSLAKRRFSAGRSVARARRHRRGARRRSSARVSSTHICKSANFHQMCSTIGIGLVRPRSAGRGACSKRGSATAIGGGAA